MAIATTDKATLGTVERIDAIIRELKELRRQFIAPENKSGTGLTDQLFGALGHGSREEYEPDLDWQRLNK